MTPEEMAARLNGREYARNDLTNEDRELAAKYGLVIVTGASDDLCEFDGAIYEEFGAGDGTVIRFNARGALQNKCRNDDCPYHRRIVDASPARIVVRQGQEGVYWSYETTISHATFDVMEDGNVYCRGIVFRLSDIPETAA